MGTDAVLTIRSRDDLPALSRHGRRKVPFRSIRLDIPGLADAPAREERLNRNYFACGCAESSVATLVVLVGALAWITLRPEGWAAFSWSDAGYVLGALVLGSGIGRWFGRQRARFDLSRDVTALYELFAPAPDPKAPQHRHCGWPR